jgi:hypothetical protein
MRQLKLLLRTVEGEVMWSQAEGWNHTPEGAALAAFEGFLWEAVGTHVQCVMCFDSNIFSGETCWGEERWGIPHGLKQPMDYFWQDLGLGKNLGVREVHRVRTP